jgi:hypothetical protein
MTQITKLSPLLPFLYSFRGMKVLNKWKINLRAALHISCAWLPFLVKELADEIIVVLVYSIGAGLVPLLFYDVLAQARELESLM